MGFITSLKETTGSLKNKFDKACKATKESMDEIEYAKDTHDITSAAKTCIRELKEMSANDIPLSGAYPSDIGKMIQVSLGIPPESANGLIDEDMVTMLKTRIERDIEESERNAIGLNWKSGYKDMAERVEKFETASNIDGETIAYLLKSSIEDGTLGLENLKVLNIYGDAMEDIGSDTKNGALLTAGNELKAELKEQLEQAVAEPSTTPTLDGPKN